MNKLFKFTRITLLYLLAIAFISGVGLFLYASIPIGFYAGWQFVFILNLFLVLAFWLICKNYLVGAIIPFFLTYKAFPDAYKMTASQFVWLLSKGPSVLFSIALSIMITIMCAMYIVLWLTVRKAGRNEKNI